MAANAGANKCSPTSSAAAKQLSRSKPNQALTFAAWEAAKGIRWNRRLAEPSERARTSQRAKDNSPGSGHAADAAPGKRPTKIFLRPREREKVVESRHSRLIKQALRFFDSSPNPPPEPQGRARHSVRADVSRTTPRRARSDAPYPPGQAQEFNARIFSRNSLLVRGGEGESFCGTFTRGCAHVVR